MSGKDRMNKVTQKLCDQVGIDVNYLTNTKQIGLIEKLVELVVDECIEIIYKQDRLPPGFFYGKDASTYEFALRKHFGVDQ